MLQHVIQFVSLMFIVHCIVTKEQVMATDRCNVYKFKSPFYPGKSCEDIYNMNPESCDMPGYYWILDGPSRVYCGMTYTGSSCEDVYRNNPETGDKSGYYRINSTQWTYCEMTGIDASFIPTCAGVGGGWRRIVNINITAGDDCPSGWYRANHSGVSFCYLGNDLNFSNSVCSSTFFSTNRSYQRVCGRVRGYQKGYTAAFYGYHQFSQTTIDGAYADSLAIHYGSPRQHIWSYVAGFYENYMDRRNCPCSVFEGLAPPYFLGSNFYCESAGAYPLGGGSYYFNDALWDGSGCPNGTCCDDTSQSWFYRELNSPTTSDIEARLCSIHGFRYKAVLIDQLELYIQ